MDLTEQFFRLNSDSLTAEGLAATLSFASLSSYLIMDLSSDSTFCDASSHTAEFGSQKSLTNSESSLSYCSINETMLDILCLDEVARNQESALSFMERIELWHAQEIKKQKSEWARSGMLTAVELDEFYALSGRLESASPDDILNDSQLPETPTTSPVGNAQAPWRKRLRPFPVQGRPSFWQRLRKVFAFKRPLTPDQGSVSPLTRLPPARAPDQDSLFSVFRNLVGRALRGVLQQM
ncbi:hypothetical protein HPB47_020498 [Ixodes persulcatus]|uniref:Uncharacterized protein n=1 Tax=Ixodes persulcatus TaxID=34615 RepID=A0AC60QF89_IXOPE|nr:hypothetical protein HPB47_020498 [Ixodes persulcatus]